MDLQSGETQAETIIQSSLSTLCHPPRLARGLSFPAGVELPAEVVESFHLADSVPVSTSYDVPA